MSANVAAIASTDTQEVSARQVQSARQDTARTTRTAAETAAGTAAAANVALQRNQNAARVEAELQRQLTATQASNASRIDGQTGASRAVQPTPVAVAPAQTTSRQQQAADNARATANRSAQRRQDDAQRSARAQADREAQQAEQAREPAAPSASAAREYRNNQNLLQPSGSNTRRVISSA